MSKANALLILRTLSACIRSGEVLTEEDAKDLEEIATYLEEGARGL